ncbi:MAG: response regulator [Alphaproteobacteria bacterium]
MNFSDKSVLIVDDYKTMLRVIRSMLKQIGFSTIDEASDGKMALNLTREKTYDLIISDWNMQPLSGLELLQAVRASGTDSANVPFIMVTAENKVENIIQARNSGVNNYIVKPFSTETLKTKIEAVLK